MTKTFFSKRCDMYHYAASADYEGEYIRSANSHVEGWDVWSYSTKVAIFDKKKEILLYTGHRYSNTTSNSLWELRRAFDHYKRLEVYDFTIDEAWDRLTESYKEHSKHPATRKDDKQYFIKCVDSLLNLVEFYGKNCKYLKTTTFKCAEQLANDYQDQIAAKNKRMEELREERRRKEREEYQRKVDATEAICKEYDPNYLGTPTNFKQCLNRDVIYIPVEWMKEHHPEFGTVAQRYIPGLLFYRRYDYSAQKWDNCYSYQRNNTECNVDFLRRIHRYGQDDSWTSLPDILGYFNDDKVLRTSQHCIVDDKEGHVKKLLGLFLKAIDEGKDVSFVIGKHCGPYEIREYDATDKFLRVGCHCFLLENLREVYQDMMSAEEDKNKTCWNNYIQMEGV